MTPELAKLGSIKPFGWCSLAPFRLDWSETFFFSPLLQMLPDLKADNQRLKDENGALIRVISKLSK